MDTENFVEATEPVAFKQVNGLAFAELNRPSALNSLDKQMVELLYAKLLKWQEDKTVSVVFLGGLGKKGFCAGGDVKKVREMMVGPKPLDADYGRHFFETEYRLDYLVHNFKKPILIFGDGLVMGGGLGLMAGGAFRIVTETSTIAMPEITIGFFPDVGGSYFLNEMPGKIGLFLALTASRINASDATFLGLADRFLSQSLKDELIRALLIINWSENSNGQNRLKLDKILSEFEDRSQDFQPKANIISRIEIINQLMAGDDLKVIDQRMRDFLEQPKASLEESDVWLTSGINTYLKGSPTSANLIFEQLRRSKDLTLKECFQMELSLALQCCSHSDFFEGVRALLVDKDQNPRWQPSSLTEVSQGWINEHFRTLSPQPLSDLEPGMAKHE